ncbi:MAG: helix-turn-helix transcriptional regulator [Gammaproteobacteria bacterium]
MNKFLRLPQVKERTGSSRRTIYARIAAGTFPRQISLAACAAGSSPK